MNNLIIERSKKTPSIEFFTNGVLWMKGRSIPENPVEFYKQVFDWLKEYQNFPSKNTEIHVDLEYYNTSSSKVLTTVLKELKLMLIPGHNVEVHWYSSCNDDEMIEAGKHYEKIVGLPFQYH